VVTRNDETSRITNVAILAFVHVFISYFSSHFGYFLSQRPTLGAHFGNNLPVQPNHRKTVKSKNNNKKEGGTKVAPSPKVRRLAIRARKQLTESSKNVV
jgi:hypothetical protein